MAKLTNYFSHDVSALSDPKIMIMISLHGMVSYAWWWILIERLAVEEDCKLPYNKFTFAGLAIAFQISDNLAFWKQNVANAKQNVANIANANLPDLVEKFIQSLIKDCNLLDTDGTYFWSPSLQRRTAERLAKTNAILEKRREAGRLGGLAKASKYLANAKQNVANARDNTSKNSSKLANLPKEKKEKKDIIFYSTDEHDEANASDDIDINDLFEKSDTKLNDTQSKVYKVYMNEIGEISSITKERIDDLVIDFGANEVVNAISIASERGKGSIGYITAILNNKVKEEVIKGNGSNGRGKGNRTPKEKSDGSDVDWENETGEWL